MRGLRIVFDSVLFFLVFLAPWWISVLAGVAGLFLFSTFIEILIIGLVIDSLYNAPVAHLRHFQFFVTLVVFILFVIVRYLKTRLRWYR